MRYTALLAALSLTSCAGMQRVLSDAEFQQAVQETGAGLVDHIADNPADLTNPMGWARIALYLVGGVASIAAVAKRVSKGEAVAMSNTRDLARAARGEPVHVPPTSPNPHA